MAFDPKRLFIINRYGPNQIFVYKTSDPIATVTGANYFANAIETHKMYKNDLIIVNDTVLNTVDLLVVSGTGYDPVAKTIAVVNGT